MQRLYTTTALALMIGLAGTAEAADSKAQAQSNPQPTAQSQQQPKQQQAGQSGQQQAGQTQQAQQQTAQGQQQGQGQQMQARGQIDTDNDGKISAEEAQAHRERMFSALDANEDSTLSPEETGGIVAVERGYVAVTRLIPVVATAEVGGQMWSQMDQDQNQQISRQEYMQYGEQQFQNAQQRAGGKLTTAGVQTGAQQSGTQQQTGTQQTSPEDVVRWREANVDRNGDNVVSADEAAAAWTETFHQLDRNGDEQLSQDELNRVQAQKSMVDQRFAKLDSNGDGQITIDEFASAGHNLMDYADFNQDGEVTAWEYRAVRVTDQ
ncbi:MAG TPA: EF-hand domain-containing protein [Geminicoccaceae bacterium]